MARGTLAAVSMALLGDVERRDLPTLTREELICLEVAPEHARDREWRESLSERELELLGTAGMRSLVAHQLVDVAEGVIEPRDDLVVVLCALTTPSWLLLLGGQDDDPQLLFRGLPGTDHCVISVWCAGLHVHTLATNAAALREAASWLRHDGPEGSDRSVSMASADRSRSASAVVRRTAQGHLLLSDEGVSEELDSAEAISRWLERGVNGAT